MSWPPSRPVLLFFVAATLYGAVNGTLAAFDHRATSAIVSAVFVVVMIVGCVLAIRARSRQRSGTGADVRPRQ